LFVAELGVKTIDEFGGDELHLKLGKAMLPRSGLTSMRKGRSNLFPMQSLGPYEKG
jgi:hypothetical protein